jgi:hypothetical protein
MRVFLMGPSIAIRWIVQWLTPHRAASSSIE